MTVPILGTIDTIAGMVEAVAHAADVPPEVKIGRESRKRARQIGQGARKLAAALREEQRELAKIDGPVDTPREREAQRKADAAAAKAAGWKMELAALGVASGG